MKLSDKIKAYSDVTESGCWEWNRYRMPCGYGRIRHEGSMELAHRLSYRAFNGDIPDGMVVRHKCDNKCCVNPEHLEIGTQKDNVHDAISRGNFSHLEHSRGSAHPTSKLTEDNVLEILNSNDTQRALATRYGVSFQLISQIKRGIIWQHVMQHEVSEK